MKLELKILVSNTVKKRCCRGCHKSFQEEYTACWARTVQEKRHC